MASGFSLQDQRFINAAICLALPGVWDRDREAMWQREIAEALPHINRNHTILVRMAEQVGQLLGSPDPAARGFARLRLAAVLTDYAEWRLVQVLKERPADLCSHRPANSQVRSSRACAG